MNHDPAKRPSSCDCQAILADEVPWITVAQMRAVDRLMIETIGITLEQMMENAGRAVASVASALLGGADGRRIVVMAGPGGNGGGGLVAARHLALAGAEIAVMLAAQPEKLAPTTQRQYGILQAIGVTAQVGPAETDDPDLVVDALLGYSQAGPPRGDAAALIEEMRGKRTISLDTPSGLELSTGQLHDPHVVAEATVTLALPKEGLRTLAAGAAVGRLFLADISVPAVVYERLGIDYRSPFGSSAVVELDH